MEQIVKNCEIMLKITHKLQIMTNNERNLQEQ